MSTPLSSRNSSADARTLVAVPVRVIRHNVVSVSGGYFEDVTAANKECVSRLIDCRFDQVFIEKPVVTSITLDSQMVEAVNDLATQKFHPTC